MKGQLYQLMEAGNLSPLSYYFSRFVAQETGQPEESLLAQTAALLAEQNLQGDVCIDLHNHAEQPLLSPVGMMAPPVAEWIDLLKQMPWVGNDQNIQPLMLERNRVYLGKYLVWEQQVAGAIHQRLKPINHADQPGVVKTLDKLFPAVGNDETDWQKVAAAIALSRKFSVITGGPGTGKTTTVVKILALLQQIEPGSHISMAAPTGKAAARLSESIKAGKQWLLDEGQMNQQQASDIPEQASTLHRLLGIFDGSCTYNAENPLPCDCLIIDEASMVDLGLMAKVMNALKSDARVILLGDRDQLASVAAGRVLGDITAHGAEIVYSQSCVDQLQKLGAVAKGTLATLSSVPPIADAIAELHKSHRFDEASGIGKLAQSINDRQPEQALEYLHGGDYQDLSWLDNGGDQLSVSCVDWAVDRYQDYTKAGNVQQALQQFAKVRVLTAVREGQFGVDNLNQRIEARLFGSEQRDTYHGMPLMITRNDYDTGLFNGDIGLLWQHEGEPLRAWFVQDDGSQRSLPINQLPAYEKAFAMTVHKSQGSEFDQVLLLLPTEESQVVTQELIYTGATRAKQNLLLAANEVAFLRSAKQQVERNSGLAEKLWNSE